MLTKKLNLLIKNTPIIILVVTAIMIIFLHRHSHAVKPGDAEVSTSTTILPTKAAIASASARATAAGFQILHEGGNAFDAAVAVAAALAVVEPYNSGFGGGGFWLLHTQKDDRNIVIDGRERAPLRASKNMYISDQGSKAHIRPSLDGPQAAAIPGEPAAMAYVAAHYGRLPLQRTFAPALRLAINGFIVDETYRNYAQHRLLALQDSPAASAIFLQHHGVPTRGYRVIQPELASVILAMMERGKNGFYGGKVAKALVEGVDKAGGLWTLKDLATYRIAVREALTTQYHGAKIITVPLPSAGGIGLITMLNILSQFDLTQLDKPTKVHVIVEAMRRAYWERAKYLGDSDFVNVPTEKLISKAHGKILADSIDMDKPTPSESLRNPGILIKPDGNTTHYSVLDTEGNYAAVTISLNHRFGSAFVPPGTGVLLNDHMDDFSTQVGVKNLFGLVGHPANQIAPGKRPLSSMTPTFIVTPDKIAILGTPGGSRIITMVLLATLDFFADTGPKSWVALRRYHHQYLPDVIQYEPGAFAQATIKQLTAMGYQLQALEQDYGNMQAILWDKKNHQVYAASDPRHQQRYSARVTRVKPQ